MCDEDIDDLVLDEIMARWPQVLRVFIDWHLHCIACPISRFHTLAEAAAAHGYPIDPLRAAVLRAINDGPKPVARCVSLLHWPSAHPGHGGRP